RRVRVVTRTRHSDFRMPDLPEAKYFQNAPLQTYTYFIGLEDDKGTVLLPCVFKRVVAVPGRGVFLQSHLKYNVWESYSPTTSRREVREDIEDIAELRPNPYDHWTFNPELPDTFVITTRLPETVNLSFQSLKSVADSRYGHWEKVSPASLVPPTDETREITAAPLAQVEAWHVDGQLLARYDKVAPVQGYFRLPPKDKNERYTSPKFSYFQPVRDWQMLHPVSPTGEPSLQLVDKRWQPVSTPLPLARRAEAPLDLVVEVPGSDELYWALTDDGKFAPWPGTVGFRLLGLSNADYEPACIVAYEIPEGLRFGWLNPKTGETSGPIWKDVRRLKTPALEVGEHFLGPTVAVQLLDSKWKLLDVYAPQRMPRDPKRNILPIKYRWVKFGRDEWNYFVNLLAEREQESVNANASNEASIKWSQYWYLGKIPGDTPAEREEFARIHWAEALRTNSTRELNHIANAMGGNYSAQLIERDPNASIPQLESALASATDAALRVKLQARLDARKKQVELEAAARQKAIADQARLAAANAATSQTSVNWNAWNNWATARDSSPSYAQQSAASAARLQSMHDYLYGKNNNPLLNPFKSWK
ncbi:MAG TPA: hypothetical protein VF681_12225, partial [Abditibacteriaceae bacterium]